MLDIPQPEDTAWHGRLALVVLDDYDEVQLPPLKRIRAEVATIARKLQRYGFGEDSQNLIGDGRSPSVRDRLQLWQPNARRVLLYWAGHGKPEGVDEYYLCCRDTVGHPGPGNAVSAVELGVMLADKSLDAIVVVVDACNTGGGAREIFTAFDKRIENRGYPSGHRPRLAVISSAQRHQQAREVVFVRALLDVLENGPPPATESYLPWGEQDAYLTPHELAEAVAEKLRLAGIDQAPECKGAVANFFLNLHHFTFSPDVEVEAKRRRGAWLPADVREHFMLKFRGIDSADERGWYFTGREQPLREIVTWLLRTRDGLLVVTGPPGCGKSAVLGRLAVLSDEGYRSEARKAGALTGVRLDTDPGVGAITAGIHAKNKTLMDCVGELADALNIPAPSSGWQNAGDLVTAIYRRRQPVTILLDALDEARPAHVMQITRDLLRALADLPRVRVVVGTRPGLAWTERPPTNGVGDGPLLKALAPATVVRLEADPDAVAAVADYVEQRLQATLGSAYSGAPVETRQAAEAVAGHSRGIFLFGRLLARTLARQPKMLDLPSEEAQRLLRGGVTEAFAADLARYAPDEQRVRDLLTPLAWAEGAGLPRRDVWLAVTNGLTDDQRERVYSEHDLAWVLEHAGAYLIESGEDGQTVYRLYHQAFTDYLQSNQDEAVVHSRITDALLNLVGPRNSRDWPGANPYLHRHLCTHAAMAGRLEELVADSRYLLYANPLRLASVLGAVDHRKYALARLYWRTLDRLHDATPVQRAALLQSTAIDDEPAAISLLQTQAELPWRGLWTSNPPTPFHRLLTGHSGDVRAVAIGQVAGRMVIISGGDDGTVRLWDAGTGEQQAVIPAHTGWVRSVAVGEVRGRVVIVSGGDDGITRVWDAETREPLAVLVAHTSWVCGVAVGEVGGRVVIVSGGRDGMVRMWDADRRQQLVNFPRHPDRVYAVAIGRIGDRVVIVSGSRDGMVRIWDTDTGEQLAALAGHPGGVYAVAVGEVGGRVVIVSGGRDGMVRIWDTDIGEQLASLAGHIGPVYAVAMGQIEGREAIVSSGDDATVRVWDANTGKQDAELVGRLGEIYAVAIGRIGGRAVVLSGGDDSTIRVWDAEPGKLHGDLYTGHMNAAAIGQARDRTVIIAGGDDAGVRVWDANTGERYTELVGHTHGIRALAIGRIGRRVMIVSGDDDGTVRVWDLEKGRGRFLRYGFFQRRVRPIRAVAIGEVGSRVGIVAGGDDGAVRVWDAKTRVQWATLPSYHGGVHAVALGRIRQRMVIVSGADDGTVSVWGVEGRRQREDFEGHTGEVRAVAIGEIEGRVVIVSGGRDGTVRVWDIKTGEELYRLAGHHAGVGAVAVGQIGPRAVIVSGGDNGTMRIWDDGTATQRAIIPRHHGWTGALAVGQVGHRTMIVFGSVNSIQVLELLRLPA